MKTYTLHVSLPGFGRLWRKIEMRADQTLADLHGAIQDAFEFDFDHMYSFFMSGRAWDQDSEYCLPEGVDFSGPVLDDEENAGVGPSDIVREEAPQLPLSPEDLGMIEGILLDQRATEEQKLEHLLPWREQLVDHLQVVQDAVGPGNTLTTTLDDLDLEPRQEFLYLFDYGDEWRFKVRVHAINPDAPEGEYPRLVEAVGQAPEQYPSYDEDEDGDDSGQYAEDD